MPGACRICVGSPFSISFYGSLGSFRNLHIRPVGPFRPRPHNLAVASEPEPGPAGATAIILDPPPPSVRDGRCWPNRAWFVESLARRRPPFRQRAARATLESPQRLHRRLPGAQTCLRAPRRQEELTECGEQAMILAAGETEAGAAEEQPARDSRLSKRREVVVGAVPMDCPHPLQLVEVSHASENMFLNNSTHFRV